jgi:antitoxin VapB
MSLNIKNEEAHSIASRLAEITGESLTRAVTVALRERLDRIEKQRNVDAKLQRVLQLAREAGGGGVAPDHGALLYDERGLPG